MPQTRVHDLPYRYGKLYKVGCVEIEAEQSFFQMKDHGDTLTNVNLQGEVDKKYTIGYFLSDKPQRPALIARWPKDSTENLKRLVDAGIPMDRGIEKCHNCEQLGHTARHCKQEKREYGDRPIVKCALCGEEGHRVRDCTQERKQPGGAKTCRNCGSEDHMAKDCPDREKRTCRNCGSEDHIAKDCDQARDPSTIQCHNCDAMGHISKACPKPRDWSRVICKRCGEKGHGEKRCKKPAPEEDTGRGWNENAAFEGETNGDGWDNPAPTGGSAHNDWEVAETEPVAPVASSVW